MGRKESGNNLRNIKEKIIYLSAFIHFRAGSGLNIIYWWQIDEFKLEIQSVSPCYFTGSLLSKVVKRKGRAIFLSSKDQVTCCGSNEDSQMVGYWLPLRFELLCLYNGWQLGYSVLCLFVSLSSPLTPQPVKEDGHSPWVWLCWRTLPDSSLPSTLACSVRGIEWKWRLDVIRWFPEPRNFKKIVTNWTVLDWYDVDRAG